MAFASLLAFGLQASIRLNFWVCLGVVLLGMYNGIVATNEDEMPGGFGND